MDEGEGRKKRRGFPSSPFVRNEKEPKKFVIQAALARIVTGGGGGERDRDAEAGGGRGTPNASSASAQQRLANAQRAISDPNVSRASAAFSDAGDIPDRSGRSSFETSPGGSQHGGNAFGGGGGGYFGNNNNNNNPELGRPSLARSSASGPSAARAPVMSGEWATRSKSLKNNNRGGIRASSAFSAKGHGSSAGGGNGADGDGKGDGVGGVGVSPGTWDWSPAGGGQLPRSIILPNETAYLAWFLVTLLGSLWTGCFTPYVIAFSAVPGLEPFNDAQAVIEYLLFAVYLADVLVRFRLAFHSDQGLVTSPRLIARRYVGSLFFVDLLALVPFDYIAIPIVGSGSAVARPLMLLGLLRLIRLYRVGVFFQYLEYNLSVSLTVVTIARNLMFVLYVAHWAACGMFFLARAHDPKLGTGTWIGRDQLKLNELDSTPKRYVASLYWAVTTFATVGYGDWFPVTVAETLWTMAYMLFNVALTAFIVGTITLLVVRRDARTSSYRERSHSLRSFAAVNQLPEGLKASMQEHLRLSFANEDIADERVLGSYPTVLRRRALRHLYLSTLRRCYLFEGGRQRFVDALLAASHVELLMPGVEVVADGDHVAELIVCVSGTLEALDVDGNNPNSASNPSGHGGRYGSMGYDGTLRGGNAFVGGPGGSPAVMAAGGGAWPAAGGGPASADSSLRGGVVPGGAGGGGPASDNPEAGLSPTIARATQATNPFSVPSLAVARQLGEGDAVGEVSFFTEVPQCGAVRTLTVARVLCIPRARYEVIARDFPLGTRAVLENLRKRAAAVVDAAFGGDTLAAAAATAQAQQAAQAQQDAAAGNSSTAKAAAAPGATAAAAAAGGGGSQWLSASQERALADSLRIKALASSALARTDERRTSEFLSAASRGDATTVRLMLNQNFNANAADYDGRTALMLASAKGHREVVALLLSSRADPSATDNLGGSALLEAARHGHDDVLDALVAGGARWHLSTVATASELCTCVFECHMPLLRRLLKAGARADAGDYDNRTALHIASSENVLAAVKALVEAGADVGVADRWGSAPLDEAVRVGARAVIDYLLSVDAPTYKGEQRTAEFLNAASGGDCDTLRHMLQHGVDVNVVDYDRRSGLMLAAGAGHAAAVNTLLGAGADANLKDTFGGSALLEAVGARRRDLVDLLASSGAELGWDENKAAGELCSAVAESDAALLELYLAANAPADSGDYDRRRALHIAAADGKLELVKMLVEKGRADPGVTDRWGATPLREAVKSKHREVVDYLVSVPGGKGRELGVSDSDLSGLLCTAVLEDDLEALKLFAAAAGSRLNAGDYDKRTALHIAAAEGNVPAIEILLAGGANCGPVDRWSCTPLLEAVKAKKAAAIDALLARGAAASGLGIDENALSGLLCSAAEAKDVELINLYIKAGAPCDAGDYDKRTAIHLASAEGNTSIVEALLRAGASPLVKDRWGATPLDEARREGRRETVALLEAALKK